MALAEIRTAEKCLKMLLDDDEIAQTIVVMRSLQASLGAIEHARNHPVLSAYLLRLSSESIREALHKGELHITNAIIRAKNRILQASGLTPDFPDDHQEIDPKNHEGYHW